MILITVGSQKFKFDRLLKYIDDMVKEGLITEEVFAQIGYSEYNPENYKYKAFLDRESFKEMLDKSDLVITHAGTGTIISAIKKGKKVIAIPRYSKYGEHVDDHQVQIVKQFANMNLIYGVKEVDELPKAISEIKNMKFKEYISNTKMIISSIDDFISNI